MNFSSNYAFTLNRCYLFLFLLSQLKASEALYKCTFIRQKNRQEKLTRRTDLLYILMYCGVSGTSSILKVTPVKLSCLAMYIPLSFISMATISIAPTPLKTQKRKKEAGTELKKDV